MQRALIVAAILAGLATPVGADTRSNAPPPGRSAIHLDWAEMPNADNLVRDYPPEARQRGVSGDTRIECTVEPDGTLVECETLAEKPLGLGFGPAAIEASRRFRMKPYPAALIHGQLPRVIIPIHWTVAQPETAPPPSRASATPKAAPKLMLPDVFDAFLVIAFIAGFGAAAALCGITLSVFILRGEGTLRGARVSRWEEPILYWFNVAALAFLFVVTAAPAGFAALMVIRSL